MAAMGCCSTAVLPEVQLSLHACICITLELACHLIQMQSATDRKACCSQERLHTGPPVVVAGAAVVGSSAVVTGAAVVAHTCVMVVAGAAVVGSSVVVAGAAVLGQPCVERVPSGALGPLLGGATDGPEG